MKLREEGLSKSVVCHACGRHVVSNGVRLVVVVEKVELLEAHLDVGLGISDSSHDWRL